MPPLDHNSEFYLSTEERSRNHHQKFTTNMHVHTNDHFPGIHDTRLDHLYYPQFVPDHGGYNLAKGNVTIDMGQLDRDFGVGDKQPSMHGVKSVDFNINPLACGRDVVKTHTWSRCFKVLFPHNLSRKWVTMEAPNSWFMAKPITTRSIFIYVFKIQSQSLLATLMYY